MASSASALLKLELQANGENDSTWGDKANDVFRRLEEAIAGRAASISLAAGDATLTDSQFVESEARKAIIEATGTLGANRNIIVPARTKVYLVQNNTSGSFTVTVKTAAGTGVTVRQGGKRWVFCDGTNVVGGPEMIDDESPQLGGALDANAKNINESKSANLASAATTDLSTTTGNFVDITGTVTITAFGSVAAGASRVLRFTGILTLTHNATSLILPSGANIQTAVGDVAHMRSLGSGNWICVSYMRADGTALISSGSVVTAQGDLIRGSSGGAEERLALGSSGQVLTSNGTTCVWGAPGQSDIITTRGDLIRGDSGGAAERYALGANGTILTSNGVDAVWAANAAQADVITTRGDVITGNASGNAQRIGLGSNGQVLGSDGTDVVWTAAGQPDVITTRGDIVTGNSSGNAQRLALGASGTILTSNGTDAVWSANAAQADVITTRGDVVIGNSAGNAQRLALGTNGQILTSNGVDAVWAANAAVPTSRTITAGTGLTGGGDLSSNRTIDAVSASDTAAGIIERAVQSEMEGASDNTRAVTPGRLVFHPAAAKAWAHFDGTGTAAIDESFAMSSLTDIGSTGQYDLNYANNFSTSTYARFAQCDNGAGGGDFAGAGLSDTTKTRVVSRDNNTGTAADIADIDIVAFGDR